MFLLPLFLVSILQFLKIANRVRLINNGVKDFADMMRSCELCQHGVCVVNDHAEMQFFILVL